MVRATMAALVVGSLLWAAPVRAAEAGDAAEIRAVIEAQLEAFRADDGARAFGFASPAIQSLFGDPETFLEMVRRGYPAVHRPRRVEFQDLLGEGGGMTQRVLLVGPDGVPVVADYLMQRQPDGSWRINGCILERAPDQTA
jgi:hypothetical protein